MLSVIRSLLRYLCRPNAFARSQSGVSAVEFAMILPAMLVLLLGTVETGNFLKQTRNLNLTVDSIGQMVSRTDVTLTASDAQFIRDSAMVSFPEALSQAKTLGVDWTSYLKIGISGILFTQRPATCVTGHCQYYANAWWTAGHSDVRKVCGTDAASAVAGTSGSIFSAADGASPTTDHLPMNIYGPHQMIAVVASIPYAPLFGSTILPSLTLTRGAYFLPRNAGTIGYSTSGNATFGTLCPGF